MLLHPETAPTWYQAWIATQRESGAVPSHLCAMLLDLLENTEREYGGPLPEPTKIGAREFKWETEYQEFLTLTVYPSGMVEVCIKKGTAKVINPVSPTNIAAALHEFLSTDLPERDEDIKT